MVLLQLQQAPDLPSPCVHAGWPPPGSLQTPHRLAINQPHLHVRCLGRGRQTRGRGARGGVPSVTVLSQALDGNNMQRQGIRITSLCLAELIISLRCLYCMVTKHLATPLVHEQEQDGTALPCLLPVACLVCCVDIFITCNCHIMILCLEE